MSKSLIEQWMPELAHLFYFQIKPPPAFASKEEEILFYRADACAWTFRGI
jgi:hypothetical protein